VHPGRLEEIPGQRLRRHGDFRGSLNIRLGLGFELNGWNDMMKNTRVGRFSCIQDSANTVRLLPFQPASSLPRSTHFLYLYCTGPFL